METTKPFEISKHAVVRAWGLVKANDGAEGVDGETIEQFESKLKGNLYKLWNRLSSGSYLPPPTLYRRRTVEKEDWASLVFRTGWPKRWLRCRSNLW